MRGILAHVRQVRSAVSAFFARCDDLKGDASLSSSLGPRASSLRAAKALSGWCLATLLAVLAGSPAHAALEPGDVAVVAPAMVRRPGIGLPAVAPVNVSVSVGNGGASALRVDTASLTFAVGTTSATHRYEVTGPVLPVTIEGGDSATLVFVVRPRTNAEVLQPVTLRTAVTATDLGTDQAATQGATTTWRVQPGARIALGQPDMSTLVQYKYGMYAPEGAWMDGTRLFVADYSNHRVLVWNSYPTSSGQPPDFALGQPDLNAVKANNGGCSASTFYLPFRGRSDGQRLFVSDSGNNRVLIWNSIPTSNGQPANVVLGQYGFSTNGSGCGPSAFSAPAGIDTDGTRLFVADQSNYRVLIWNVLPTTNHQAADLVLGQANLTSSAALPCSSASLTTPQEVLCVGSRLFVADRGNHRVLVWNSIPTTNNQPADLVLGQPDFTTKTSNTGGRSAASMYTPLDVASDGTRLLVADYNNNRVLIWNSLPTTMNQPADLVLGQLDFTTSNGAGLDSSAKFGLEAVKTDGTRVCVVATASSRVLIWNTFPTTNGQAADLVLGQPDFTGTLANYNYPNASRIFGCSGVHSDGSRLFAADTSNHRVLKWNLVPTSSGRPANVVLGQPDFVSNVADNTGFSESNLDGPRTVCTVGDRLIVGDTDNNRVLLWNSIPTTNAAKSDVRLGGLYRPYASTDGTRLLVADYSNNRVLIWSSIPSADTQPADLVLGQPDLLSNTANNGGLSASSLSSPRFACSDGRRLFVADWGNSRVLIWNEIPTTNKQAANVVVGQPNFVSTGGSLGPSYLYQPAGVLSDGTRLFVTDQGYSRVLCWSPIPTTNGAPATDVLGQDSFTATASRYAVSGFNISSPTNFSFANNMLWVTDGGNKRILGYDLTPPPPLIANVGPSRTAAVGLTVPLTATISGFTSTSRTFAWRFLSRPAGSALTTNSLVPNDSASAASSAFTPDTSGAFRLLLTVSSSLDEIATATLDVTAVPGPSASAGPDRVANLGTSLTLAASASDPDDQPLTYRWTRTGGTGASATLSSTSALSPVFTPLSAGTYTYMLAATNPDGLSGFDSVTLTGNTTPVADAGLAQTVTPLTVVTLDGGRSRDPDANPLTFQWTAVAAPVPLGSVALTAPTSSLAICRPTTTGTYAFELTVSDGRGASAVATATVNVVPGRPLRALFNCNSASAGTDVWVANLDGSDAVNLTQTPGDDTDARWSPDRRQILFRSDRTGTAHVYVMNADGSDVRQVDQDPLYESCGRPRWSADGRSVYYQPDQYPPGGERVAALDGTGARFLFPGLQTDHGYAVPYADASYVAYVSGETLLQYCTATGSNLRTPTVSAATLPEWSPDRTHLLYTAPGGSVWRVRLDGSAQLCLAPGPDHEAARYSPDGTRVFFNWNPPLDDQQILAMRPDGTGRVSLSGFPPDSALTDLGVPVIPNMPPVARASVPETALPSEPVPLDAQLTYDPNGDPLTYSWTQTAGTTPGTFTAETPTLTRFTAPRPGTYSLRLTASDGRGLNSVVNTSLTALNRPPVLPALPAQRANLDETVQLDVSGATDPDFGQALAFEWTQTLGLPVTLSNPAAAVTTFLSPLETGTLGFVVRISDGQGGVATATATVLVEDRQRPTVTLTYQPSAIVTRIGLAAVVATFSEPMRATGLAPSIRLSRVTGIGSAPVGQLTTVSASQYVCSFYATPANNGVYSVLIAGVDRAGNPVVEPSANNLLTIAIANNAAPIADAGFSQVVRTGTPATLNGSASYDPDGEPLTFSWSVATQPAGSSVVLSTPASPWSGLIPTVAGLYVLRLSVADTVGLTSGANVSVAALPPGVAYNRSPRARVALAQPVFPGGLARLDGSASSDADGNSLAYSWAVLSKPAGSGLTTASLTGGNSPIATFRTTTIGPVLLRLTVSDGQGGSDSTNASVTVTTPPSEDYSQSFAGASVRLEPGQERTGVLGTSLNTDFLAFPVALGQMYTLSLSTTDLASAQLAVFSPQGQVLVSAYGSPDAPAVIRDFRPGSAYDHAVRLSSPTQSTGHWRLTVTARADNDTAPPPLELVLQPSSGGAVANISTRGTTSPLSALQLLVSFDGDSLKFVNTSFGSAASTHFNEFPRTFSPPFVDVSFQSKTGPATIGAGLLEVLNFQPRVAESLELTAESAAILEVSASRPLQTAVVRRPTANSGVSLNLESVRLPGGRRGFPDPLAAGSPAPWVRLDGRCSTDGNVPTLPLAYRWSILQSPSTTLRLSSEASAVPTFAFAGPGVYRFGLHVSNGVLRSATGTVQLVVDRAQVSPAADAGCSAGSTAGDSGREALAVPAGTLVRFDGAGSTDPDAALRSSLTYRWSQLSGPALGPLPATADFSLTLSTPGTYLLSLLVTNRSGLQSLPDEVGVVVHSGGLASPQLSVVATSPATPSQGLDLGADDELHPPAALQVLVGAAVSLTAHAGGSLAAPGQRLSFFWQQVEGPAVRFSQSTPEVTTATVSRLDFNPAEPGLHVFACTARAVAASGSTSRLALRRLIRVAVGTAERPVPSTAISVRLTAHGKTAIDPRTAAGEALLTTTGSVVTLNATGSGSARGQLAYTWRQVEGPLVKLSNPYGSVTTFVVPNLGDTAPRVYSFQLYGDDGALRSEPDVVRLTVAAGEVARFVLSTPPGLNLIGIPLAPLQAGQPLTLDGLATMLGSPFVTVSRASTEGRGQFVVNGGALGAGAEPVRGGLGYLVRVASSQTLTLSGSRWPQGAYSPSLLPGINLISFPGTQLPASLGTAQALLALAPNASFLARLQPASGPAPAHFELALPGVSPSFPLEPGRGYLLFNTKTETLVLPEE